MSGRTWLMMALMLGLNWGGFVVCLWLRARNVSRE
jgi:hypothetical protein